ncbi:class I SAM-dependent methyltransferase [Exiguobacterium sp. s142]|uniref:class I SAM-dependent methyltransferase n=1 Tax=Exiguobacterium sp. s142 TaxID=2751222 RepID=UPI001BE82B3F|nr:class I SAM-dependent methyltransferase [Exiguobacterium sp. s142]
MGLQFMDIFKEWATQYDTTVAGHDEQYKEVFAGYEEMLSEVVDHLEGKVMEFGVGTGNLSMKILERHELVAVEPSPEMRAVAAEKLEIDIIDGDFLNYPTTEQIDTIVSSYAFHHLTDEEKRTAIQGYVEQLDSPRFVLLDTMFASQKAKRDILDWASGNGYDDLVEDLNREFYPYTQTIQAMLEANGYTVSLTQKNKFVWLVVATKQSGGTQS